MSSGLNGIGSIGWLFLVLMSILVHWYIAIAVVVLIVGCILLPGIVTLHLIGGLILIGTGMYIRYRIA